MLLEHGHGDADNDTDGWPLDLASDAFLKGDAATERRERQDVSWPLDMNRPISRITVSKSVSFYDEP